MSYFRQKSLYTLVNFKLGFPVSYGQNRIFYCNFDGQTNSFCLNSPNLNPIVVNNGASIGSSASEIVPGVSPNWFITDFTSISNL